MDLAELDKVYKNLPQQDFTTLESMSQKCSKSILMELLDGKTTLESSKDVIQKCQAVISEYQKHLYKKIEQHH